MLSKLGQFSCSVLLRDDLLSPFWANARSVSAMCTGERVLVLARIQINSRKEIFQFIPPCKAVSIGISQIMQDSWY